MKKLLFILLFLPLHSWGQYFYGQKAAGGGASLPTTNLWAYYEADDAASITQTSNAVSQWRDKSGNARHWNQATTSIKPDWNGSNTITFTGSSGDIMSLGSVTMTQPVTVYVVCSMTSSTAGEGQFIFGDASGFSSYAAIFNSGSALVAEIGKNTSFDAATTFSSGTLVALKFQFNNASSQIDVNTTTTTGSISSSSSISTTISIGQYTGTSVMAVKGLYVYQGALPSDASVRAYLTSKWGKP